MLAAIKLFPLARVTNSRLNHDRARCRTLGVCKNLSPAIMQSDTSASAATTLAPVNSPKAGKIN
jgi:hypothetical protein